MRLWQPAQVQVVNLAQELGIGQPHDPRTHAPHAPLLPHAWLDVAQMLAGRGAGWTLTNDFGDVIDPWGSTGFAGVVDPRY